MCGQVIGDYYQQPFSLFGKYQSLDTLFKFQVLPDMCTSCSKSIYRLTTSQQQPSKALHILSVEFVNFFIHDVHQLPNEKYLQSLFFYKYFNKLSQLGAREEKSQHHCWDDDCMVTKQ